MTEKEEIKITNGSTFEWMFAKFCERTSIPGVPQVRQSKNPLRKLGWTIFIIFGLGMAIYQSKDLISEYHKRTIFIVRTEKDNVNLQYPAITFCPQMPILWETAKQRNHKVYNTIIERGFVEGSMPDNVTYQASAYVNNIMSIWSAVFNLTDEERDEVLLHFNQYFVLYSFDNFHTMPEILYGMEETYVPHYGNCFTFDPIYERKSREQNLQFLVYLNKREIPPNTLWEAETKVFIHAPNTCPPFQSNNYLLVKPQQHLRATVSLREFHRLPAPYPSDCFDTENNDWRILHPSLANETSRFLYSKEQCEMMQSALTNEKFNCNLLNLPVQKRQESVCGFLDDYLFRKKLFDCPFPCHEFQFDWKPLITPFQFEMLERLLFLLFNWNLQDSYSPFYSANFTASNITFEEFLQGISLIDLYPASTLYTSFSEEPKYTLGDLLGAIGGNLGLWIGISLISFIEVFDFVMNLIGRYLKLLWRKIWKKNNIILKVENGPTI